MSKTASSALFDASKSAALKEFNSQHLKDSNSQDLQNADINSQNLVNGMTKKDLSLQDSSSQDVAGCVRMATASHASPDLTFALLEAKGIPFDRAQLT
eukprot:3293964-Karenia_brevis.AAC.1